ncbi:MAG: M23 family metallopeptidase [Clostridia bacterium]|nr:M23 family metallopeptidase [Clostridia bacterium]
MFHYKANREKFINALGKAKKLKVPVSVALLLVCAAVSAVLIRQALTEREPVISERAEVGIVLENDISDNAHPEAEYIELPSDGVIVKGFSSDAPVWNGAYSLYETHAGVDFALGDGFVRACAKGRIESIETDERYGLTVTILHENGCRSGYASLSEVSIAPGKTVKAGEIIGKMGVSAVCESDMESHLHFFYEINGKKALPPFASNGQT